MSGNRFAVAVVFLLVASSGFAQSNDVAVSFGGTFSPGVKGQAVCEALPSCPTGIVDRSIDPGFSVEGTYAHRLANFRVASLHLELPVLFAPSRSTGLITTPSDFSSFFVTPSLKLKLLPSSGISPFVSVGGGLARFKEDSFSSNKGAVQYGGGVDFKTRLPLLGFRFEVRDFMTSRPGIPAFSTITSDHLHNLFVGGGITLHF
ncbi:MAG TPA: hypothetical protein VHA06_22715 [Candidatus Angelobacter sp.]|jgi:hypothetical protein|nr:hypothetical protein [Candidatus Angelobacter sp.]